MKYNLIIKHESTLQSCSDEMKMGTSKNLDCIEALSNLMLLDYTYLKFVVKCYIAFKGHNNIVVVESSISAKNRITTLINEEHPFLKVLAHSIRHFHKLL